MWQHSELGVGEGGGRTGQGVVSVALKMFFVCISGVGH